MSKLADITRAEPPIKPNPWFEALPRSQQAKLIYTYKQAIENMHSPDQTDRFILMVEIGLALPRDAEVPEISPFPD